METRGRFDGIPFSLNGIEFDKLTPAQLQQTITNLLVTMVEKGIFPEKLQRYLTVEETGVIY